MKLVVGMLVKNEADRYLAQVIENICLFADELVVLDDQSTDGTVSLIRAKSTIPVFIHPNYFYSFANEIVLRKMLYEKILERNPDWHMVIDADEVYHRASRVLFDQLINQNEVDVWGFRLYDMWDEKHYRADHLWRAHEFYAYMLVRFRPEFKPLWRETPQHCGRLPVNMVTLRVRGTELMKIKHYGWARAADRVKKYERYKLYDPEAKYGVKEQYESILDTSPNLVRWMD